VTVDVERLRRLAPLALPLIIVAGGWLLLIGPSMTASVQAGRAVDSLEQELAQLRASVGEPPPPAAEVDPVNTFTTRTVAGDASSRVVLQLASLAQRVSAANLSIETGNRVVVAPADGPQVSGGAAPTDPRLALFNAQLAYTPITMAFDADFAAVGAVLWAMRDLPTTIEIRSMEIAPRAASTTDTGTANDRRVHVTLIIFAYAREGRDAA
jgi:hypothetical protein